MSGGTYERLAFAGHQARAEATRAREVYFLDYAADLKRALPRLPLMLSGGFRNPASMVAALQAGAVDVIGVARSFCTEPTFPKRLLAGSSDPLPSPEKGLRLATGAFGPASPSATVRALHAQAATAWCYWQLERLAAESAPEPAAGVPAVGVRAAWGALVRYLPREIVRASARRWRRRAASP